MARLLSATLVVCVSLGASFGIASADDVPLYACKQAAANAKMTVEFRPDTSVMDLATWVTGFTCKSVVIDAEVRSRVPKVTIVAPAKLTPKQAEQLFVDAVEATGLVVLRKKDTIVIKLGPKMPRTCPSVADTQGAGTTSAPTSTDTSTGSSDPAAEALQKLLDSDIRKIDETHVEITKRVVDEVLTNSMAVAKSGRIVPSIKDGKPNGLKLYAIRPTTIFGKLGLRNGDTLLTVNGNTLNTGDQALEVYTKLRGATKLVLGLERRGKPLTLTITIK